MLGRLYEAFPPLPLPPIAFDAALAMSEAVSLTVLTTLLITLRALEIAPPFFEELRFFAGAFFAAFFAGAFFEAFFAAAFFAGAFFVEAEAFFDDAFFDGFLLAPFFEDDFFAAAFLEDFFADFFEADFFDDDFLADAFFEDFFLAAMDFSPIQN